jgi:hypothetical protein
MPLHTYKDEPAQKSLLTLVADPRQKTWPGHIDLYREELEVEGLGASLAPPGRPARAAGQGTSKNLVNERHAWIYYNAKVTHIGAKKALGMPASFNSSGTSCSRMSMASRPWWMAPRLLVR